MFEGVNIIKMMQYTQIFDLAINKYLARLLSSETVMAAGACQMGQVNEKRRRKTEMDTLAPTQASIGMSVYPDHRCKGVGRSIIMHLTEISREKRFTPICGCWYYNHNSKLTLESAGFVSKTRLLNVHFTEDVTHE